MRNVDQPEGAIVTCSPASEAIAGEELRRMSPALTPPVWIADGILLMGELPASFEDFAAMVARQPPLFIRHIAPVQRQIALRGDASDLPTLRAAALELAPRLNSSLSFAVQSRLIGTGPLPYRTFVVNRTLSDALHAQTGAVMDARNPPQIVSILCTPTIGYIGLSRAEQNRSLWPGGEHRFRREEAQISRAEFKLLEALSVFGIALPAEGTALDLGAAPGGWTRVLQTHGLRVVAVDPAELDPRLKRRDGITHIRKRVQDFLPCKTKFDVVVNDLRMDALDSAEIMRRAAACLKPGGMGIMTLKLPESAGIDALEIVHRALERLAQSYIDLQARQLFHNRSEVTVAGRVRPCRIEWRTFT